MRVFLTDSRMSSNRCLFAKRDIRSSFKIKHVFFPVLSEGQKFINRKELRKNRRFVKIVYFFFSELEAVYDGCSPCRLLIRK